MEDMDNKFLKQKLDKFGENVSLPNSLKAENLLSLIENISPDEPVASLEKKVIWFDKKYAAIAAMIVLAVGFAFIYNNIPQNDMLERDRVFYESSPEMSSDESEMFELYQDEAPEAEEYSQDNGLTGGGALKSAPRMESFGAKNYEATNARDWNFSGDTLYQNDKKIFEFPKEFAAKDYYAYADSLIFYGEKELDGKSSVYIFKRDDSGYLKITQSFRQEGSILEVDIFGEKANVISIDKGSTFINSYSNSTPSGSFKCNFTVNDGDIYLSIYGFAISDGHQVAYAFDENGSLLREIEIEKGKYIDSMEVQEKNIVVFLNNGETLDLPITK